MKTTRRLVPRVGMSCACILIAGAMLLAACEETQNRDDDDDDDNNNNNTTTTTATGGSGGQGTGGVLSQGGSGGTGNVPTVCDYPSGPYGINVGAVVSKYQTFTGVVPGGQQIEDFKLSDLYDCDGTHGVDAVLVVTTQYG